MIPLIWAMLRARRTQALTVALMALLAVAAAVSSAAYVDMARQRILADDLASAPLDQRSVTVWNSVRLAASPGSQVEESQLATSRRLAFEQNAPRLVQADGFTTVFSVSYYSFFLDRPFNRPDEMNGVLEYRQGFCEHVILVQGRCVSGPGEVLVTSARAATGYGVSRPLMSTPVKIMPPERGEAFPYFAATAAPTTMVVVGVYEPRDPADPYWGSSLHLDRGDTVLTDRQTVAGTWHVEETQTILAYPRPDTVTLGRLGAIRSAGDRIQKAAAEFRSSSDINALVTRVEEHNRTVALVAGVASVPLVVLCWYVLFLAITSTAQARRTELGMVKLRGVSRGDQWWIAAAEGLTPVLAGAAIGYLSGHLAVWAYARQVLGPAVSVHAGADSLLYAVIALGGAVVAGVIAMRRDLVSSATELMRRVPAPHRGWQGLALAVVVCALAGLSLAQLRSTPVGTGPAAPADLGRFAPALLIVGIALLCAVLVDPVMGWLGARAMRRGRVALALAGLHIGRRRSGSRLLSLVMVAVGLLTFAGTASSFAAADRVRLARLSLGADQVLTVTAPNASTLLTAVRSVDPAGDHAMAVVPVFAGSGGQHLLAVDSPRLAKVAYWPDSNGALTAQAAATALRPALGKPIEVHGRGLAVYAKPTADRGTRFAISLRVTVALLDTRERVHYPLTDPVSPGAPYTTTLGCAAGCRLVALEIVGPQRIDPSTINYGAAEPELAFESVRQTGPDRELVSGAELARWTTPIFGAVQTEPSDTGLRATVTAMPDRPAPIVPPGAQSDLAVLKAGTTGQFTVQLANLEQVGTDLVGTPDALPQVGSAGTFVDLEYLLSFGEPPLGLADQLEVWLSPDAPADIAQRLAAAGVTVVRTHHLSDELAVAQQRPAALGVRFLFVAALFGLVLGGAGLAVAAGVERRSRADELRALRIQGLRSAPTTRTALVAYVAVVAVAVVLGIGCGISVWFATGAHLPIVTTAGPTLSGLGGPGVDGAAAAAAGGVVLLVLAAGIAVNLARAANPRSATRAERTS